MTLQEFTVKMNPLLEKGRKTYTGSVLDLIFKEVKNITLIDFERLVAHLNGSQRYAPLVPEFRKAILELNIKPERKLIVVTESYKVHPQKENYTYHLRENIWANDDYIFVRGRTVKEIGFIIKSDHPGNPVVQECALVHDEKIKEIKEHLKKGTFPKFEESKFNMRKLNYSDFSPEPA